MTELDKLDDIVLKLNEAFPRYEKEVKEQVKIFKKGISDRAFDEVFENHNKELLEEQAIQKQVNDDYRDLIRRTRKVLEYAKKENIK